MPFVRESLNTRFKSMAASIFNRRDRFITDEEAQTLIAKLVNARHRVPIFEHSFFSSNISSEELNRAFDNIYTDQLIMMGDLEVIYSGINTLYETINQRLLQPRIALKSAISTSNNFLSSGALRKTYNLVDIYHMGRAANYDPSELKLELDTSTGTLRLPINEERNYTSEADMDVNISIISSKCFVFEQSPKEDLFSNKSIYYLSLYTQNPDNSAKFPEYDGIVAAVDITLPSVGPVNILRIRLVSDENEHILGISYLQTRDIEAEETIIEDYTLVNNGFVHEVEFSTIEARVIRLYLGSQIRRDLDRSEIVHGKVEDNYIDKVVEEVRNIQIENASIIPVALQNYSTRIRNSMFGRDITIPEGYRVYILPIRDISISHRTYKTYGTFQSEGRFIDANLTYVTMQSEIITDNSSGILSKITIEGRDYTITSINKDGTINDVAKVEINNLVSTTERYKITTNIIPDLTKPISVYYGENIIDPVYINIPSSVKATANGIEFTVNPASNLIESTNVIVNFTPANFDRNGVEYNPNSIDVLRVLGKPNAKESNLANLTTNFLYFYYTDISSVSKLAMYQYDNVIFDNKNDLYIRSNVAPIIDANFNSSEFEEVNVGELYKVITPYYGLHDGGYFFIEDTFTTHDSPDGNGDIEFMVQTPYVKDMIIARQDNERIPISSQYSAIYGSTDLFTKVKLKASNINLDTTNHPVFISYVPVPNADGTFPVTLRNNIQSHNKTESFSLNTPVKGIIVDKYPFVDKDITLSTRFIKTSGIWYFKESESIIYEPYLVYNNSRKLEFEKDYKVEGRNFMFNTEVSGNLSIRYYSLASSFLYKTEMFRTNPIVNDRTPRLLSFIGLAKTVT